MDQKKVMARVHRRAVEALRAQHRNKMPVAIAEQALSKRLRAQLHGGHDHVYTRPAPEKPTSGDTLAFEAAHVKRQRRAARNIKTAYASLYMAPSAGAEPKPKRKRTKKAVAE